MGLEGKSVREGEELLDGLRAAGKIAALAGGEKVPGLRIKADLIAGAAEDAPGAPPGPAAVILPRRDLGDLERLFSLSSAVLRRERESVRLAAVGNALGLLLGASGRLAPVPASLFNNLISLLVLLNSYRLLFSPVRNPRGNPGRPNPAPENSHSPCGREKNLP